MSEVERQRFVERFAAELTDAGMQRMASRIFAALLSSPAGALTAAELGEQLSVSPAAVSGAVRYLSQVGLVGRESEPGSRRERYQVRADQWFESFGSREVVLKRWDGVLADGIRAVGPDSPAGHRIAEARHFFAFLQGELGTLMDRWLQRRAELVAEGKL
ncbi:hypothetical protein SRB5_43370 [Streptomyces sp. RB5]|uniref:HTH marR-type domain-containing protein n=1 Tax=Streptomyces smaragdinus TaxID=2585196 RepID=A0A7K0CKZ7_9ACTN|nr:MarR family transcriptional regulator [Streptomyces smaragdinus]MQY14175.1 hypothetical protein [Streptomyces smaragdinus]